MHRGHTPHVAPAATREVAATCVHVERRWRHTLIMRGRCPSHLAASRASPHPGGWSRHRRPLRTPVWQPFRVGWRRSEQTLAHQPSYGYNHGNVDAIQNLSPSTGVSCGRRGARCLFPSYPVFVPCSTGTVASKSLKQVGFLSLCSFARFDVFLSLCSSARFDIMI